MAASEFGEAVCAERQVVPMLHYNIFPAQSFAPSLLFFLSNELTHFTQSTVLTLSLFPIDEILSSG